jgi:hypothetical protein
MCAIIWPWEHRKNTPIADRRGASRLARVNAASGPRSSNALQWPAFENSPGAAIHCGLFGSPHQQRPRELLDGKVPQMQLCVALVFADPGANFKMYLKNAFQVFRERKLL